MKKLKSILFGLFLCVSSFAQVASDCNIPDELLEAYEQDAIGIAIQWLQATNNPDFNEIEVPQEYIDAVLEGMAAIFNAPETPERDSVYDLYCVHNIAGSPLSNGFIIGVDQNSSIAQAWAAGELITGNTLLDSILHVYNFSLTNYFSFGAGVFQTDKTLNLIALGNYLSNAIEDVSYGEPDYLIGGAGKISYAIDAGGNRNYDFRFEWSDCFDGCDNAYTWKFSVSPDCEVSFLGTEEFGFFGIQALPDPINCMLTDIEEPLPNPNDFQVFPNPVEEVLHFKNPPLNGNWELYNAQGQRLLNGDFTVNQVNIQQLAAGSYWFRSTTDHGAILEVLKVIKQ